MDKTVLIYLENNNNEYLLIHKNKKKDFNFDKYLGIGGHIEENETKEDALIREVKEESNLDLLSFIFRGSILFKNDNYEEIMYLYTSDNFKGEIIYDNEEGELLWIDKNRLTSLNIWEGDKYFLDLLNKNEPYFEIELIYKNDKLVDYIRHM